MGPGFRVPRCSVIHLTRSLIRGTMGGTVDKPDRTKPRTLTVKRIFEPSRVAPACLVDAYERVVPVARRAIRTDQTTRQAPQAGTKRRSGGRYDGIHARR